MTATTASQPTHRFLFTSLPVEGHSTSPLAIMARLVADGHEVVWLAGAQYAERAAAVGVRHVALWRSLDYSLHSDPFDLHPELRRLRGVQLLRATFRDVFLGAAAAQVVELEELLTTFPADVIVSAGPQFGPLLVHERTGVPLAAIGDGPFSPLNDATPPFGPGLRPWPGAVGRARHRLLNRVVRATFADVHRRWAEVRADQGLEASPEWVFDSMVKADLVLQGSTPGFEYDQPLPSSVHFVGALRPVAPARWEPPSWWRELDSGLPVVHVTQGTIRHDAGELVLPTVRALAGEEVLVVVTTGGIDPTTLGELPANVRTAAFVPYEELLAKASAFVTNGGYIGTNLALHHGVPIVQVGNTEEKAEIGARVRHFRLGVAFKRTPSEKRLRRAIRFVLDDAAVRDRVARLAVAYRRHDAPTEAAAALVALAAKRQATRALTAA
jgi:UDP:flavonoid glycosyltransferase YjiC (YdhE family)